MSHKETFEEYVTRRVGRLILGYTYEMIAHDRYKLSSKRSNSYKFEKNRLWHNQDGICFWCKRKCQKNGDGGRPDEFTVDHVIPLNIGGTNHWMNLVGSCHQCNNRRGCEWCRNYQFIEFEKPSEPIVWGDWLQVDKIYEY